MLRQRIYLHLLKRLLLSVFVMDWPQRAGLATFWTQEPLENCRKDDVGDCGCSKVSLYIVILVQCVNMKSTSYISLTSVLFRSTHA
jgi:hypothetical protein